MFFNNKRTIDQLSEVILEMGKQITHFKTIYKEVCEERTVEMKKRQDLQILYNEVCEKENQIRKKLIAKSEEFTALKLTLKVHQEKLDQKAIEQEFKREKENSELVKRYNALIPRMEHFARHNQICGCACHALG